MINNVKEKPRIWGPRKPIKKRNPAVLDASDRSSKTNTQNWSPPLIDGLVKNILDKWWDFNPLWSGFKGYWEKQVGNIHISSSFESLCCKNKRNKATSGMISQDKKRIS